MFLTRKLFYLLFFLPFMTLPAPAQVRLPRLVSDGMVLQRQAQIRIWGWAAPNEKVTVHFLGKGYNTTTAPDGTWSIQLPKLSAGGPYEMEIQGSNTITIRDILVGDVWVCSGQSNMEFQMSSSSSLYKTDIANAGNKFIRHFTVPKRYTFSGPQADLPSGSWQSPDPNSVLRFSAVAYYFAKDLYERYQVPIGLINATLGGSRTESWMSADALKPFPNLFEEYTRYTDSTYIKQVESEDRRRIAAWNELARTRDNGYKESRVTWRDADLDVAGWEETTMPGRWADGAWGAINGVVWYRKEIDVPASMTGKAARLLLGNIVDADSAFVNGTFVGAVGNMYVPRVYALPPALLKPGKNTIAVRVVNNTGKGGFIPEKKYALTAGEETIDLTGKWKYRLGVKMEPLVGPTFIMWKPGGLYNGMIAPLLPYTIKGAIWYQGESNVGRAVEHRTLFPALIRNWRDKWQLGDFPFLYVQLPNFNEAQALPAESSWAMFRESQTMTLSQPNTGMAVAIDVGEWNDIHPLNKKDVGIRLARVAAHQVYGERKITYTGPMYRSMKIKGHKIILSFTQAGGGLKTKDGGPLKEFAIAGPDHKFVWANAVIRKNTVEVWSDDIANPAAVRYAWADNPAQANLVNTEGLPASPFRTDKD